MTKINDFRTWLLNQCDRNDPIGDLASDMKSDSDLPRTFSDIDMLKDHLRSKGAGNEAIFALEDAWHEFG